MTFSKKNNEFITDIMQWTYPRLTVGSVIISIFQLLTQKQAR